MGEQCFPVFCVEKDYLNLRRKLVLKYYWQVIRRYKTSFFAVITCTIVASILDVYIPLKYLHLWNVLSTNDFSIVSAAKSIVILIMVLNLTRFLIQRISGFSLSFFESSVMAGSRGGRIFFII